MPNFATPLSHSHIQGWGADLDPADRPAVPKERFPARDIGVHWSEVEPQPVKVQILKSNERPFMTPIFGTTVPPAGLSGLIRKGAFHYSENDVRHWMILLLADRINMVGGIVEDLLKGHVPNIFAEMGLRTELKHNRKATVRKLAVAGAGLAAVAAAILLLRRGSA